MRVIGYIERNSGLEIDQSIDRYGLEWNEMKRPKENVQSFDFRSPVMFAGNTTPQFVQSNLGDVKRSKGEGMIKREVKR